MKDKIVIIPVYNEEGRVIKTCEAITSFLKTNPDYKFVFVDDGSTDTTVALLHDRKNNYNDVEILALGSNVGKGAAVKAGIMQASEGEYICFIDGDMAYSFNHLPILFERLKLFDVVIGSRALGFKNKKKIIFIRRILGGGFNVLVRLIMGFHYKDTQAGLKGFRMEAAKEIFSKLTISRFSFDVELLFIANKLDLAVGEIPAIVAKHHTEKNTRVNLVADTFRMFCGLFKIHINNFKRKYD